MQGCQGYLQNNHPLPLREDCYIVCRETGGRSSRGAGGWTRFSPFSTVSPSHRYEASDSIEATHIRLKQQCCLIKTAGNRWEQDKFYGKCDCAV